MQYFIYLMSHDSKVFKKFILCMWLLKRFGEEYSVRSVPVLRGFNGKYVAGFAVAMRFKHFVKFYFILVLIVSLTSLSGIASRFC